MEAIGDLIARGDLPFSFMDVPVMAAQPRLPSAYEQFWWPAGPLVGRRWHARVPGARRGGDGGHGDGGPGTGQRLPPTHIGLHSGPVVFQDGDIYGSTANVAARLSARAAPGEILVSKPVADRICQRGRLEPVGPVDLKGSLSPLEVWRCPAGPAPR